MTDDKSAVQPELRELDFPVLVATKNWFRVYSDADALTVAWQRAVDRETHAGAMMVDSSGRARTIRGVQVLGSVGSFLGYDRFLNRSMRIAYGFEGDWQPVDLATLKQRCLKQFRRYSASQDDESAEEFETGLQHAPDARSLIAFLKVLYGGRLEKV